MQKNRVGWQTVPLMQRRWLRGLGALIAVFILIVLIVPLFVNADTFRPRIQAELSSALGRPITLGHLSFSLLSGSLVADNVAIADDPAFSTSPFFEAKALHIGVSTAALLFRRQVEITNFNADAPRIQLISGANGTWNYSSLGRGSSSSGSSSSSASGISIGDLKIKDGSVSVSSLASNARPFVYDRVQVAVQHLSFTTPMPFDLSADLPGGGSMTMKGTAGPIAQPNAEDTPLQASLSVKHFDPVAAGVVSPSEGISMVADIDGQANSNGKTATITGKVQAANLKLAANGTPAAHPVEVDVNVSDDLGTNSGRVNDLSVQTGNLAAHITGTFQTSPAGVMLNLHLAAPGLPVDGLEQLLPAMGIKLPSGSSLHGGTLTANLNITGSAAAPQIAGPVEIDNTQLAGFDLASKMEGFVKPRGSSAGSGTAIRTVKADVVNNAQGTQLSNIVADVPSIGTATGSGTVSASDALNFQMVAKLGGATNSSSAATALLNVVGGVVNTATGKGIPLSITGTTSDPSIRLNTSALLKQQTSGLLGAGSKAGSSAKSGLSGLKSLIGK